MSERAARAERTAAAMQALHLAVLQAALQALLCFVLLGALPQLGNALGALVAAAAAHCAMPVRGGPGAGWWRALGPVTPLRGMLPEC